MERTVVEKTGAIEPARTPLGAPEPVWWWEVSSAELSPAIDDEGLHALFKGRPLRNEHCDVLETCWTFAHHPLVPASSIHEPMLLREVYHRWEKARSERDDGPWAQSPLYPGDRERAAKSLLSYAVGCAMGRYSADKDGLILADMGSTLSDFTAKVPNPSVIVDNANAAAIDASSVVPVMRDGWFGDDIVTEVRTWLAGVYGISTLDENIEWLQESLGKPLRPYFAHDFYPDHLRAYHGRPIYWLFCSNGARRTFKALVYMHRYSERIVDSLVVSYLRPYAARVNSAVQMMSFRAKTDGWDEFTQSRAPLWRSSVEEMYRWERDVLMPLCADPVALDPDAGVAANYNRFPHALREVEGLTHW